MTTGWLDRCIFVPVSNGTTDFVVASAVTGYLTPANASAVNGVTYRYAAQNTALTEWEVGYGAWNSGSGTLPRTTVEFSSNSNSKVNFSSAPNVMITALGQDVSYASILNETTLAPIDGSESVRLATASAGWKATLTSIMSYMLGWGKPRSSNHIFVRTAAAACTFSNGSADISATGHGLSVDDRVVFSSSRLWTVISSQVVGSPGVFTSAGHGLVAGDPVAFASTGTYATGLTYATKYYVANDGNLTSSTFAVSDTQAHALAGTGQINTSGSPTGNFWFYHECTFPSQITEGTLYYVVAAASNTFQISDTQGGSAITPTSPIEGYFTWNTGSDSNDGTANDKAHALLTIQAAVNIAQTSLNYSNFFYFNIRCADSLYREHLYLGQVGGGPAAGDTGTTAGRIINENVTPENCRIIGSGTSDPTIGIEGPCYWLVQGVWLEGPYAAGTDAHCVYNRGFGAGLYLLSVKFGNTSGHFVTTGNHFGPFNGGITQIVGQRSGIVGTCTGDYGFEAWENGIIEISHGTCPMVVEPGWTSGCLRASNFGKIYARNDDWNWQNDANRGSSKLMGLCESGGMIVTESTLTERTATTGQVPGVGFSVLNGGIYCNKASDYTVHYQVGLTNTTFYHVMLAPSGSMAVDWTLTLPTTAGTAGYFLQNSGSGVTSWSRASVPPTTVAGLPTVGNTGALGFVTNANSTTRLSTVAGGGANQLLVVDDGTNWVIV